MSLPTRGAWIEIELSTGAESERTGRSPHGERGLKYSTSASRLPNASRSPHGERGLKYSTSASRLPNASRSPHGERGLKSK